MESAKRCRWITTGVLAVVLIVAFTAVTDVNAADKRKGGNKKKADNNRKNGNKYLTWAFVEAAHHAIRTCPPAQKWYQRKMAQRNGTVARKALASKCSKAAYYIMKRQERFDLGRVFG